MGPCCVEGCEVTSQETYYFEFPTSRLLRRKWLEVIPIPGKLPIGTVVCSRHFHADDYETVRGKVRLKRKVVPSLLLEDMKTTKQNDATPKSPQLPKSHKSPKSPPKVIDNCDSTTVSVPSPIDAEKMIDDIQNERRCGDSGDKREVITEPKDLRKVGRKENGRSSDGDKVLVKSPIQSLPDPKEDIEDMITNYQIKNKVPNPALLADLVPLSDTVPQSDTVISDTVRSGTVDMEPIEIEDKEAAPVFIEISADKDTNTAGAGNQDCLMLLESVQVEVDPSTLMLEDEEYYQEEKKKNDAISLLTSSDEDDVIIQEPHIDTVEVSDETDEDDMPLVKLVKTNPQKKKKVLKKNPKRPPKGGEDNIVWGMYDFYCMQCNFSTNNCVEYNKHVEGHSTILQVCQICSFTSASKTMFSRHKRIHKVEKKFKCHICDYQARHKMSLMYHLKNHNSENKTKSDVHRKKDFKCPKCGFKSDVLGKIFQHISLCLNGKRHMCDKCDYATKKKCDLERHKMRRHKALLETDEGCVDMAEA